MKHTTSDANAFGRPEKFASFDRTPGAIHAPHASLPLLGRAADVIALSFGSDIA
jgi:hypothetical protein